MDKFVAEFLFNLGIGHPLVWFEALLVLGALCFARKFAWPPSWLFRWDSVARRRKTCLTILFCAPIVLRVALLAVRPMPAPFLHDEFGNLLLGDTFAQGRAANPAHPYWIHFETFHVVQTPNYFSFRPPAPGLFLAPFIRLTGSILPAAWIGVLVSMGLMSMAILWALYGWLPPRWAFLGGVLATAQIGITSYWMNSYWGGEWAALGGALVLGGLGRFLRGVRLMSSAAWMAIGAAIAVNTRQLEGGLLILATLGILASRFISSPGPRRIRWMKDAIPALAISAAVVLGMLAYNYKLTGHALELPYRLGLTAYKVAPTLVWDAPTPPKNYNHEVMRKCLLDWEMSEYGIWKQKPIIYTFLERMADTWQFFVRPALGIALFPIPWILRDRRVRPLLIISAVMIVGTFASVWFNPHYIAPATAAFYGLLVQGLRHLSHGRKTAGLANAVPAICMVTLLLAMALDAFPGAHFSYRGWSGRNQELTAREDLRAKVEAMPGEHLILVHYQPKHDFFAEWVYNRADIDHSRIVWAREMDSSHNNSLAQYFRNRHVWLLDADTKPPRLEPYTNQELSHAR